MASKTANKRKEESREGALSVTRAEHYALKRRIRKFEKKNLRYIVLFPCSGDQDWYEMGDNSALLYKYVICEERGIKVKMASDAESFKEKFEIGIVKTRGTNRVKERIKQAGLYFKEMEEGGAITFILNKVFPEKELEELRKKELGRQEELKNIVRIGKMREIGR